MNTKLVKVLMLSLILVGIVVYATEGIAKSIWPPAQYKKYRLWIFVVMIINLLISTYLIVAPYHLFGQSTSDGYYSLAVTAQISYLIIGCGLHIFSQVSEPPIFSRN